MAEVVTSLAAHRHRDTIGVLRHLLRRAERGEIRGLAFLVDDRRTSSDISGSTGSYKKQPCRLASAVVARLAITLADAQRLIDARTEVVSDKSVKT
jgi:hypothetical protein